MGVEVISLSWGFKWEEGLVWCGVGSGKEEGNVLIVGIKRGFSCE